MPKDYFTTFKQTLPRLGKLITKMRPTFHLKGGADVTSEFIREHGLELVIWDIDGTLMSYHADELDPDLAALRVLFREGPAKHVILSNCNERRFEQLAKIFPEVPVIRGYQTKSGQVFRYIEDGKDTHTKMQLIELIKGGAKQIRKPNGELVLFAMEHAGVLEADKVLVVGDQHLTDIASANLAGVKSAKVPTFKQETFPRNLRLSQGIEAAVYRVLYRAR